MADDDSGDELYQLQQRALFVQYPTRPINLDTIPLDGNEFIHKSRLQDANLSFVQKKVKKEKKVISPEENEQKHMRDWARKSAVEFGRYALKLITDKDSLKKKFPKKHTFPGFEPNCVQEWCLFCLGSRLSSKIYDGKKPEAASEVDGHLPVLSIVVHLDQCAVFAVLMHLHEWFLSLGMDDSIAKWVYAILACLKKPVDEACEDFLRTFYNSCKKRLKDCDELERHRLYLISTIIDYYFCINSYKVGPPLERFLNMTIKI